MKTSRKVCNLRSDIVGHRAVLVVLQIGISPESDPLPNPITEQRANPKVYTLLFPERDPKQKRGNEKLNKNNLQKESRRRAMKVRETIGKQKRRSCNACNTGSNDTDTSPR